MERAQRIREVIQQIEIKLTTMAKELNDLSIMIAKNDIR